MTKTAYLMHLPRAVYSVFIDLWLYRRVISVPETNVDNETLCEKPHWAAAVDG